MTEPNSTGPATATATPDATTTTTTTTTTTRINAESTPMAEAGTLLAELASRSNEIDHCRQLPQDLARKLAGAGCYRLCAPQEVGGLGVGVRELCEVVELLAGASGSAAWCAFIASTSHLNVAGATEQFRRSALLDPDLIVAGVFASSGTARRTERDGTPGYLVNGHWRWASGCHNAHWISGALTEVDHEGQPVDGSKLSRLFFHPSEVEILDNWHVTGLRGTGSSDVVADNVWVPAERAISTDRGRFANEAIFTFPVFGVLSLPTGAIAMGMARACVDELADLAQTKTPSGSRRTLATRPLVHFQFAQAHTELAAARALFYQAIDEAWARAEAGESTLADRVALRTANWHAVQTSARVIDTMYSIAGGSAVFESSPLPRHKRDVHVVTQHMMVADSVMELAGRVMLGADEGGVGL